MSYTFGIWKLDYGISRNADDLREYFDKAWNEGQKPDPFILKLITTVTEQFPDKEDSEFNLESCVWDSIPLIDQAKGLTFYPGIRLSLGDGVLEAVAECLILESGKLGLHVIDWQTEEIYAPDGVSPEENT